jgi:hypothetical protein
MSYSTLQTDLAEFLDYDVDGAQETTQRLINRAVRYIQDFYGGKWNHLWLFDQSVTSSNGTTLALPSDFNVMDLIAHNTLRRYPLFRGSDYEIQITSPSNLVAAVTRVIKFHYNQTAGTTFYLSYWRKLKEYAANDVYPDIPLSEDAILATAKWLGAVNERAQQRGEVQELKAESIELIRKLRVADEMRDQERSAAIVDVNNDGHSAATGYGPGDGGGVDNIRGPIMDRNYGG